VYFIEKRVKIAEALGNPPPNPHWPPATGTPLDPMLLFSYIVTLSKTLVVLSSSLYFCYKKTKCALISDQTLDFLFGGLKIFLPTGTGYRVP